MDTQELSAAVADILHVDVAELASRRFADLIGDSLAALEFSDRVFGRLGVRVDLGIFYRSKSVAVAVRTMSSLYHDQGDGIVNEAEHG
jgi:Phosphopantetheine attachment site